MESSSVPESPRAPPSMQRPFYTSPFGPALGVPSQHSPSQQSPSQQSPSRRSFSNVSFAPMPTLKSLKSGLPTQELLDSVNTPMKKRIRQAEKNGGARALGSGYFACAPGDTLQGRPM